MTNTALTKILVFDSGVGGLSILQALQETLPGCEYIYASDNEAFPYGTKSAEFLITRVQRVLQALIKKTQPHIIVVACNTASTLILPHIRRYFTIPIVGVVPAIKPAALQSKTKVIGLLGTPGTVTRDYTKALIEEFANDCEVVCVGSSELVILAEEALRGIPPPQTVLSSLLKPLFDNHQLDTIVLACTHFPLIKKDLADASPRSINWIDSGEAIARRVRSLLGSSLSQKPHLQSHANTAIFTQQGSDVHLLQNAMKNFLLTRIEYIKTSSTPA